jgi:hypothetical protein
MLNLISEYDLVYKHIKHIAIEMWETIEPDKTWERWLYDNSIIAKEYKGDLPFYPEASFLCGAFGYTIEFADDLVKHFYINEHKLIKTKIDYGRQNKIISDILGV